MTNLIRSTGYDLQKVSQHLEGLSASKKSLPFIEPSRDSYDLQSFLKNERENAVLSVIEEVKKSTFELVDNNYWEYMNRDWLDYKSKLSSFICEEELDASTLTDKSNLEDRLRQFNDSIRSQHQNQLNASELNDIECIINQIVVDKDRTDYDADVQFIYNLREFHNRTIELLNNQLGSIVADEKKEGSKRERLELFTLKLAERFCNEGNNADKETIGVFYLLLDLMTFFDYYHNRLYNDAFDVC